MDNIELPAIVDFDELEKLPIRIISTPNIEIKKRGRPKNPDKPVTPKAPAKPRGRPKKQPSETSNESVKDMEETCPNYILIGLPKDVPPDEPKLEPVKIIEPPIKVEPIPEPKPSVEPKSESTIKVEETIVEIKTEIPVLGDKPKPTIMTWPPPLPEFDTPAVIDEEEMTERRRRLVDDSNIRQRLVELADDASLPIRRCMREYDRIIAELETMWRTPHIEYWGPHEICNLAYCYLYSASYEVRQRSFSCIVNWSNYIRRQKAKTETVESTKQSEQPEQPEQPEQSKLSELSKPTKSTKSTKTIKTTKSTKTPKPSKTIKSTEV